MTCSSQSFILLITEYFQRLSTYRSAVLCSSCIAEALLEPFHACSKNPAGLTSLWDSNNSQGSTLEPSSSFTQFSRLLTIFEASFECKFSSLQMYILYVIGALLDLNVVGEAFETSSEEIYHPRPSATPPSRSTAKFNHNLPLIIQVTS